MRYFCLTFLLLTTLLVPLAPLVSVASLIPVASAQTKNTKSDLPASSSVFKGGIAGAKDDAPIYIKSNTLELNAKSRIFTYSGEVEVVKGDLRITADEMIGEYDTNDRIRKLTAKGSVVITNGESMKASSNYAEYFVRKSLIELTQAPELYRQGNVLTADKVKIFVDEDRSEAEGRVRVKLLKAEDEKAKRGSKKSPASPFAALGAKEQRKSKEKRGE